MEMLENSAIRSDALQEGISKKIDTFRSGLEHINERWQDRLAAKDIILWEDYIQGNLSLALIFERCIGANERATVTRKRAAGKTDRSAACCFDDHIDPVNIDYGNNEVVLVDIVKVGDGPDRLISTAIPMRLNVIEDKFFDLGESSLYRRLSNHVFEVLPGCMKREARFTSVGCCAMEGEPEVVKRGPQVMDSVAHNEGDLSASFAQRSKIDSFATVRLFTDGKGIGWYPAQRVYNMFELVDVAIGPFDL